MTLNSRRVGARLGMVGYASILQYLQKSPATVEKVAEAFGITLNTARFVLRKMHAVRLIRIGAWQARTVRCGGFMPVWHFGRDTDAPYPDGGHPLREYQRANNVRCTMVALAELLRTLETPSTKAELQDRTGLNDETIRVFLNHAKSIHLVRIAGWQPTEGDGYAAALWQIGSGPSAPRPKALSRMAIDKARRGRRRDASKALALQHALMAVPYREAA